ncbi:MAG: DUF1592 domain-containing protein [Longimicrobiales bacterium]
MTKFATVFLAAVTLNLGLALGFSLPDASSALDSSAPSKGPAGPVSEGHGAVVNDLASAAFADNEVVQEYCVRCHNERRLRGNLSLEEFDATNPAAQAPVAEKMIRKLRAGMMPPPGARRPEGQELDLLMVSLEEQVDEAQRARPQPGTKTFQRLNRAEYERAVYDLLGLEIDASAYLPGETVSGGFDNIADVQNLSATLLEAYLTAAAEVSRLALGDLGATPSESTYEVPRYAEQREHVEGAPFGTRGGISIIHNFPADGEYYFRLAFQHESTGNFFGQTAPFDEEIEVSVDGERVALFELDRWMHRQDPNGVEVVTGRIPVPAGAHRVSAAFVRDFEGPVEDLTSPHEWSLADKKIGYSYGITGLAHLRDLTIGGPYDVVGISDTPIRSRVLACEAGQEDNEVECAKEIIERIGTQAFRRPLTDSDREGLFGLYQEVAAEQGFEVGVRTALQGILASPDFVFRFEEVAEGVQPGQAYPLNDLDLASRLSFFLWGRAPDDALIGLAAEGKLSEQDIFEAQVDRLLADPRSEALGSRFASQWLRLQDLDKVHPDALRFPDFYQQLADDLREETELFFNELVGSDGSLLELFTADYTYVNERLARHYGFDGVAGHQFRKVTYPDEARRGLLGHGSILTLTSHANRTSPVLRGKWVMEVLMGTPPPPPPPDVPDLDATDEAADGRFLTVRERMEQHRASPTCNSCHRFIDPIGLALENFDVTGQWRVRDNGAPVESVGELYDGTALEGPADLRRALLSRPEPLVRTFTENLMAYALGRRVEYFDMPTIREITRNAADENYRMSAFIKGVANSPAFRMGTAGTAAVEEPESERSPEGA